jgi:hypothetical protein
VQNKVAGDFNRWTKGYGYWVRAWDDGVASTPDSRGGQPGILANNQISGAEDYSGLIQNGWNLLAFPDGTLRYTASGFKIAAANISTLTYVVSPFGEHNVTAPSAADTVGCATFNAAVATANAAVGNVNALEVSCLSNGTDAYLISSKPFYLLTAAGVPTGITSLAGYQYVAADTIDIDGNGLNAFRTRLGEYALLVEQNEDYAAAATPQTSTLGVGLPSWYAIDPLATNGSAVAATIDAAFNGYLTGAAVPTPSYDTAKRARADVLESNSTETGSLILLAANNRFYVRDNTAVRLFDAKDVNGSKISIDFGGGSYITADGALYWSDTNSTDIIRDCSVISTIVASVQSEVKAICYNEDTNGTIAFFSDTQLNFDVKEINASAQLLVDRYIKSNEDNASAYGALRRVIQPSQLYGTYDVSADQFNHGGLANLTYTSVWAEDFPNSGALYYLAGNGFKPEMILTGLTSDGNSTANPAGTISWKALDTTRDPKAWFDAANDFELFWTEKERGYWVYVESGYSNPVTVGGVNLNDTSVVTKHFNNKEISGDEINVFNWLDGYISADIGGLVRASYTSGETYTVRARLDSEYLPLATTGAVSNASATFTSYLNDFEVSSLRPTGLKDLNVTATDGLGGTATGGAQIAYVKPATPTVSFSGNTLAVHSNQYAKQIVIYQGDVSDENTGDAQRVYNGATQSAGEGTVDLSTIAIEYPAQQDVNSTRHIMNSFSADNAYMVADLRVIAATEDATANLSVFSNMRKINYIPAYSDTFHVYANGEQNVTAHTAAYGDALNGYDANRSDDVAFRGANAKQLTLIYKPINPNQGLANNAPQHVDVNVGGSIAQIQYLKEYEGQVFYIYDDANSAWYYGVFPGDDLDGAWGASGYDLRLAVISGVTQTLAAQP